MRFDTLQNQKIFKEEPPKERATMRWHDRDPADYGEARPVRTKTSLTRRKNSLKSKPKPKEG